MLYFILLLSTLLNRCCCQNFNFSRIKSTVEELHREGSFVIYYLPYLVAVLACYLVHWVAFRPLKRIKAVSDVGWSHINSETSHRTKVELINKSQRLRKIGNLPPVFPNGWFAIHESENVEIGKVKSVKCLGEQLAVFRGEDGIVNVLDAYCPHLGANIAVGGIVKGNCLECPFHGWQFDGQNGKCTTIPYASKVPELAKVKSWTSVERYGFIFIWFDAEGRPPAWQLPIVDNISDGTFTYKGKTEHNILAHVMDIPENGSDMAHLGHLHFPNIMKGANLFKSWKPHKFLDLAIHHWVGTWKALEAPREHVASVKITHSFSCFGGKLDLLKVALDVEQVGPGLVLINMNTMLGKAVLVQTVTPHEPLRQKVMHRFYSSRTFITPFANMVLMGEALHLERDIMIWNSKQYMSKPLLVSEDKLISRFRRWYAQFYSENSPRFESFRKEDDLQW